MRESDFSAAPTSSNIKVSFAWSVVETANFPRTGTLQTESVV
jgi:hypothetical protein